MTTPAQIIDNQDSKTNKALEKLAKNKSFQVKKLSDGKFGYYGKNLLDLMSAVNKKGGSLRS